MRLQLTTVVSYSLGMYEKMLCSALLSSELFDAFIRVSGAGTARMKENVSLLSETS